MPDNLNWPRGVLDGSKANTAERTEHDHNRPLHLPDRYPDKLGRVTGVLDLDETSIFSGGFLGW